MCIVGHINVLSDNSSFSKLTYIEYNAVGIYGFDCYAEKHNISLKK